MPDMPWFKLYASDYLVDAGIDSMPREAEALLVRMWCICHIEGSCPNDPGELARKTRCDLQYVLQCKPHCDPLFDLRNGRLYSKRMEAERKRSKQASLNAHKCYEQKTCAVGTANRTANSTAERSAPSDYDSDSSSSVNLSTKTQFNSTEVAQAISLANGWSGRQMIWALQEAIDFQSAQMPESSLEEVGEWLVKSYFDRRASKGDFAGGPQKFFQQALYRQGLGRVENGKVNASSDDLVARTMA
jgi:uncharacterized protein YdaU (DUF1376 family)